MSTISCESSVLALVPAHSPQVGNAHDAHLAWLTYERIIIEDAAATKVSFQGIDRKCYAECLAEQWRCNCVKRHGDLAVSKCEHILLLESAGWCKLLAWSRRSKTAIFIGEIAD